MKTIFKLCVISVLLLSLIGCFVPEEKFNKSVSEIEKLKVEITELKNTLGEFQYLAMNPEIQFIIKDVEFISPKNEYDNISVKFKVSLKQNNKKFPLSNYQIWIFFAVLDENNNELNTFMIDSEVENGVLALAEDETLFGLKDVKISGCKIIVKEYIWNPFHIYKPV